MVKLEAGLHNMLNNVVLISLQEKGITTVADFLRTDSNKLRQITNIGK